MGVGEGEDVAIGSGVPSKLITMTGASPAIGGSVVGRVENMPAGGDGAAEAASEESLQERSPSISKKLAVNIRRRIDIRLLTFCSPIC